MERVETVPMASATAGMMPLRTKTGLISLLIWGSFLENRPAASRHIAPQSITVVGAPMLWAAVPARRLPNGAGPMKDIE